MDATNVARELAEFRPVCRKLHTLICVDDLLSDTRSMQKTKVHDDYDSENEDEDDDHHV